MVLILFRAPEITAADLAAAYEWAAKSGWHVFNSSESYPIDRSETGEEAVIVYRRGGAQLGVTDSSDGLVDAWQITRERRQWRLEPANDVPGVAIRRYRSIDAVLEAIGRVPDRAA